MSAWFGQVAALAAAPAHGQPRYNLYVSERLHRIRFLSFSVACARCAYIYGVVCPHSDACLLPLQRAASWAPCFCGVCSNAAASKTNGRRVEPSSSSGPASIFLTVVKLPPHCGNSTRANHGVSTHVFPRSSSSLPSSNSPSPPRAPLLFLRVLHYASSIFSESLPSHFLPSPPSPLSCLALR